MEERQTQEEGINLIDYIAILLKRRWLIISITLGAAMAATIISLHMTPIYRAETKIFPPLQRDVPGIAEFLARGGAGGMALGGPLPREVPNELYIELLKSRPVLDPIIDGFGLMELYETKSREDVRKRLLGSLKTEDDRRSGIITIGVEDEDPERAAALANAFVEELKSLNRGLAITEASQRRLFFEEQLKGAKDALIKSEETVRGFQEKTGAIRIDEQARALIEGIARLRAEIATNEVGLKVMHTYATPQNPDLQRAEEKLKGLKVELSKLEAKGGGQSPDPLMPAGKIPAVSTEHMRKLREFKYSEALYKILLKQYEAAKFDEAKDFAAVQVVEEAIPPEKKVRPKKGQMVLIAGVTGFFFSIFVAFFMEYIKKSGRLETPRRHLD